MTWTPGAQAFVPASNPGNMDAPNRAPAPICVMTCETTWRTFVHFESKDMLVE
jgi:hypothetical protein